MRLIVSIVLAICAVCFAAPIRTARQSDGDTDLEAETDRLLFTASMAEFQAARDAQDPPELDWYSNGCTASPDVPLDYNFLPSCQRHDFGYHNYKNQGRFDEGKAKIDSNFKADMYNECNSHGSVGKVVCKGVADVYYEAVSIFGGSKKHRL